MASNINFKNFRKGDYVIVTVKNNRREETLTGKITNISYDEKVIFFDDGVADYECKFSEIKNIVFDKVGNFDEKRNTVNQHSTKRLPIKSTIWGIIICIGIYFCVETLFPKSISCRVDISQEMCSCM